MSGSVYNSVPAAAKLAQNVILLHLTRWVREVRWRQAFALYKPRRARHPARVITIFLYQTVESVI